MTPPENEITHSAIATFVSIIKSMANEDHDWESRFNKQLDTFIKYLATRHNTPGKVNFRSIGNCNSYSGTPVFGKCGSSTRTKCRKEFDKHLKAVDRIPNRFTEELQGYDPFELLERSAAAEAIITKSSTPSDAHISSSHNIINQSPKKRSPKRTPKHKSKHSPNQDNPPSLPKYFSPPRQKLSPFKMANKKTNATADQGDDEYQKLLDLNHIHALAFETVAQNPRGVLTCLTKRAETGTDSGTYVSKMHVFVEVSSPGVVSVTRPILLVGGNGFTLELPPLNPLIKGDPMDFIGKACKAMNNKTDTSFTQEMSVMLGSTRHLYADNITSGLKDKPGANNIPFHTETFLFPPGMIGSNEHFNTQKGMDKLALVPKLIFIQDFAKKNAVGILEELRTALPSAPTNMGGSPIAKSSYNPAAKVFLGAITEVGTAFFVAVEIAVVNTDASGANNLDSSVNDLTAEINAFCLG